MKLDPETGALKELVSDSEAVDPALITSTGTAISDALIAEKKRREEAAAAVDELTLLQRERDILKAKKEIEEFKDLLGEGDQ